MALMASLQNIDERFAKCIVGLLGPISIHQSRGGKTKEPPTGFQRLKGSVYLSVEGGSNTLAQSFTKHA